MSSNDFEAVIGIEIHVQLSTKSKIFSADSTAFDSGDNENTSPVSVGMPGTLPVLNEKAVELSVKTGLALGCKISPKSVFARKNYFYPDLPKGYQISQHDKPICEGGSVSFQSDGTIKTVSITRAHMEEDAGKSIHHGDCTLINYNRAGVPLLEIVSGPDMRSPVEAAEYCRTVRQVVRYLGVCDGNMEEGSMRCDCNVSVKRRNDSKLGTKVEIKNVNSFRFVEKAIEYEIERQIEVLERGDKVIQETRLWDPDKNRTFSMRVKEDVQDYRYFPEPDLLPVLVDNTYIEKIRLGLPELPAKRRQRFKEEYGLSEHDAELLTSEKEIADYFEETARVSKNAKASANWIMSELLRELNQSSKQIQDSPLRPEELGSLIGLIDEGTISGKIAKTVFQEMWSTGKTPTDIVKEKGLVQITDPKAIEALVDQVLAQNTQQVEAHINGTKKNLFGYFVGAVMKASQGQANPDLVNKILKEKLKS